jgi:hypothetical protein
MHGGYITLLVFMSIIGACLIVAAYRSVVDDVYEDKAITKLLKVTFTLAYIVLMVFLGMLFDGMTAVGQFECMDQGTVTCSSGNSTTPATYEESAASMYLGTGGLSGMSKCSLYWTGRSKCTAADSLAAALVIPGCGCRTVRTPTSYVQKFNVSRKFTLRDMSNDKLTYITLTTPFVYESEDAAKSAAQYMTLPSATPIFLEPSDAETQSVTDMSDITSNFVDVQRQAELKSTGAEGSMITGSIASGILGLGIIYGVVEYYRNRRNKQREDKNLRNSKWSSIDHDED